MTIPFAVAAVLLVAGMDPADPAAIAPAPRKLTRPSTYRGQVLAVDSGSITIRGSESGDPTEVLDWKFPASPPLLSGEQDRDFKSCIDYRLSDVWVGDWVYIRIRQSGKTDLCAAVIIERRPGGFVPPALWENPREHPNPHHEAMNAWQAFEERGVPLPAKYDPVLKAIKAQADEKLWAEEAARHKARMMERFAREEREWARDHTAPPPRAVKR